MWKLFKRDVTFNKGVGKRSNWSHHLDRSRFLFALLKFLRQTRHMRRRVRKRVVKRKKPQKKQTKKVSKSGKGKDGPLTLELRMTSKMLEEEVGHTPPIL